MMTVNDFFCLFLHAPLIALVLACGFLCNTAMYHYYGAIAFENNVTQTTL